MYMANQRSAISSAIVEAMDTDPISLSHNLSSIRKNLVSVNKSCTPCLS